jgi:hypothetical protein
VAASTLSDPGRAVLLRLLFFASKGSVRFPNGAAEPLRWLVREFPNERTLEGN